MKQLYSADRHSPTPTRRKRQTWTHKHMHARFYSYTHTHTYTNSYKLRDIILEDNWHLLRRVSPQFTAHLGWLVLVWRLTEGLLVKWRSAALLSAPLYAVSCHESFVRRSIANTLIPEGCTDSSWSSRFRHFQRQVVSLRCIYICMCVYVGAAVVPLFAAASLLPLLIQRLCWSIKLIRRPLDARTNLSSGVYKNKALMTQWWVLRKFIILKKKHCLLNF